MLNHTPLHLIKDNYGKTPFDYAKNQPAIKQVLIENKYGVDKDSLLHLAAARGDTEIIKTILKEKVDINGLNDKGRPVIYVAAEKGYLNVVKLLLKKGADPECIFDFAIETRNLELLRILLLRNKIQPTAETNSTIVNECVKIIRAKSSCSKAIKCCTAMLTALVVASYRSFHLYCMYRSVSCYSNYHARLLH